MSMIRNVIHDGDHGGDDFIATLAILNRPDRFNLLGISTCGGNIDAATAARNALIACELSGETNVPVFVGSNKSFSGNPFPGDGAHGVDGIGGAEFPLPRSTPRSTEAVTWLVDTIGRATTPVTIFATGPLTNIARALKQNNQIKNNIHAISIMGGAFGKPGGNITPDAEFNFAMDPDAAHFVLAQQDINIKLFPLDATHSLCFSPRLRKRVEKSTLSDVSAVIAMLRSAEKYDIPRFHSDGAFIHDPQVVYDEINPKIYSFESVGVHVNVDNGSSSKLSGITDTKIRIAQWSQNHVALENEFVDTFKVLK